MIQPAWIVQLVGFVPCIIGPGRDRDAMRGDVFALPTFCGETAGTDFGTSTARKALLVVSSAGA